MASYSVRYIFDFVVNNQTSLVAAAAAVRGLSGALTQAGSAMAFFGRASMLAGMAAGVGAAAMVSGGIRAAAAFEDKMAEVRKVVPDMTKEMMWDLGDDVLRLSTQSAVAADAVADIFASGARMGIRGKDAMAQFAETVVKVAAAWDGVSASMAAESLATISGKFFNNLSPLEAQKRMIGVTDAINYLAQNTPGVKNMEMLKFFQNAGPQAANLGLTPEQTAAWGATAMMTGKTGGLEEGTRASMSMQRMMLAATGKLRSPTGKPTNLATAFKTLGMTQKEWGNLMVNTPQEGVLKLFEKMEGWDKLTKTKFLKDFLGDARAARQLTAMSGQLNEYKRALAQTSDEYARKFLADKKFMDWMEKAYPAQAKLLKEHKRALHYGSVEQEYQARLQTLVKQFERFKNALYEIQVRVGRPFLEPLQQGFGWLADTLSANKDFAAKLSTGGLIAGAAAFGVAALRIIGHLTGIGGALNVLRAMAAVTLKIAIVGGGIAAAMWLYENWDKMREAFERPTMVNILFPEMPEWLKFIMRDGLQRNRELQTQMDDDRTFAQRARDWWNNTPNDGRYRPGADVGGYKPEQIPQTHMFITTRVEPVTFMPASISVNGTVDVNGIMRLHGSGPLQANDARGTAAKEVSGGGQMVYGRDYE